MNRHDIGLLLRRIGTELFHIGIAIVIVGLILLALSIVSAQNETEANITPTPMPTTSRYQDLETCGKIVYYGEIVNMLPCLTDFKGTGNYQVSYWFYNHTPGTMQPDRVYDISFPKARVVDKATFPYEGVYYQQFLEGETIAIPVMEVREGKRAYDLVEEQAHQANVTPKVEYDPYPYLPPKKSSYDYLVARGDVINMTTDAAPAPYAWIFQTTGKDYYLQATNNGTIPSEDKANGKYDVVLQWMGNSSVIGVSHIPAENAIRSPCKTVKLEERLPGFIEPILMSALENPACSDDPYVVRSLAIEKPYMEISNFDQWTNETKTGYFVQGYTNLASGSVIQVIIDKDRWEHDELRRHTFNAVAYGEWGGEYRRFRTIATVDFDEMQQGNHTLYAISPYGDVNYVDIYINEAPEGTPPPDTHMKWISNNPFIPVPTPVIEIREVVREVVREVPVNVIITPSDSSCVNFSRDTADRNWSNNVKLIGDILGMAIIVPVGLYFLSVVVRAWKGNP